MSLPSAIRVCDVGPRDGLQNEPGTVPVEAKVALVEALADSGVPEIEVGSFVNPKLVPRMADTAEVFRRMARRAGTTYSALVPNRRGAEAAIEAGAGKLAVFTSASESFSRRNVNASIAETLERFAPVFELAASSRLPVRAYLSCAFACPDEGPVAPQVAARWSRELLDRGAAEIDVSDTIGVAVPLDVERVLDALAERDVPIEAIALHFHDTRGTAVANAWTAMRRGVSILDSSCGGLGGCPFAPGATGNLATEDLLYLCSRSGIATGIDFDAAIAAAKGIGAMLGRPLSSRTLAASIASGGCEGGSSQDHASRRSPSS